MTATPRERRPLVAMKASITGMEQPYSDIQGTMISAMPAPSATADPSTT